MNGQSDGGSLDNLYKILLIGDSGVGKSCLLLRFADDTYVESYISTIGVDFKVKTIETPDGKAVKLQIWDTAGQDRFKTICASYYRGADGLVVVFDITDADSLTNVSKWISEAWANSDGDCSKILVGNKSDLSDRRVVSREEGEAMAKKYNMRYIESSAKRAENVDDIFYILTEDIARARKERGPQMDGGNGKDSGTMEFKPAENKDKKCC